MKRTTVFLDEEVQHELKLVAEREGVPAASLLREAVGRYLSAKRKKSARPLSFLAVGRSGKRTTAQRHEEILWKDLDPHDDEPQSPRRPRNRK